MHDLTCMIQGCQARVYAPAGTHSICRTHFLSYLTWRRRKGPQMFMKYAGMTMEERNPLVAEWANTIRVEEAPTATAPKTYRSTRAHKQNDSSRAYSYARGLVTPSTFVAVSRR